MQEGSQFEYVDDAIEKSSATCHRSVKSRLRCHAGAVDIHSEQMQPVAGSTSDGAGLDNSTNCMAIVHWHAFTGAINEGSLATDAYLRIINAITVPMR